MQSNEHSEIRNQVETSGREQSVHKTGFRDLVLYLADRIGRQHIPVHDDAADIHDLLGADAVHHELIKNTVRRIYRSNHCGHLDAPITQDKTFKVLGAIRKELAGSQFTDIDQINLLDSVGDACRQWFHVNANGEPQALITSDGAPDPLADTVKVVQLSNTG
jgi:hypothetical protein